VPISLVCVLAHVRVPPVHIRSQTGDHRYGAANHADGEITIGSAQHSRLRLGTIVDINKPDDARDACIAMVDFPVYCGPAVVPLTEIRAPNCKGMSLTLAWAITIRKAQGMTLNRITVDLGRKEFASGVALSPCKSTPRVKTTYVRPRLL
jgi:hypothetical protein